MLYNQKTAISYSFKTIRQVSKSVALPQKIQTISHKPWQVKGFQISKALHLTTISILKQHLRMGVIKPCYGLYQNSWYFVKKNKPGKYQLVNTAIEINQVTLRDVNLPP